MPNTQEQGSSFKEWIFNAGILHLKGQVEPVDSVLFGYRRFNQALNSCKDCFISPWSMKLLPNSSADIYLDEIDINLDCHHFTDNKTAATKCVDIGMSKTFGLCEHKPCKTKGSYPKDCLFPFTFKGRLYDTCITLGSKGGLPWCSLKVESETTKNVVRFGKQTLIIAHLEIDMSVHVYFIRAKNLLQTTAEGEHIKGNEGICSQNCPVSDCPVGFWPHLKTCIQISASSIKDAPRTIKEAENECFSQGTRLFQPRTNNELHALFYSHRDSFVFNQTNIHAWTSNQEIALGMVIDPAKINISDNFIYHRDGSKADWMSFENTLNWATGFPTQNSDDICITFSAMNNLTNKNCTGYSDNTSAVSNFLSYVCEARPVDVNLGVDMFQYCHFPYKLEPSSQMSHSCQYDIEPDGTNKIWCPVELSKNQVVIPGKIIECHDERYTTTGGPGLSCIN